MKNVRTVPEKNTGQRSLQSARGSEAVRLGRQLALHRGRSLSWSGTLVLVLAGMAALAPLAYSLWLVDYAYTQYGSVAASTWGRSWLIVAALAAASFLLLAFYRLYLFRRSVAIHTNGLRLRPGLLITRYLTWDQIQAITSTIIQEQFLHLPIRTYQQANLIPRKGKPVNLRAPLEDLPGLIQQIKNNLYTHQRPQARARFQNGQKLDFGPLAIHPYGLRCKQLKSSGQGWVPWNNIRSIDVKGGRLNIQIAADQSACIPVSKIHNFEMLMELIQQEVKV